jgi:phosphatidylserine/phosphatidylglycerophosphate/cardiolipin synthase-like enzyme
MTWQLWCLVSGILILIVYQLYVGDWLTAERLRLPAISLLKVYLAKTRSYLLEEIEKEEQPKKLQSIYSLASLAAPFHVFFSPDGGCEQAVRVQIQKATESIYIMAYYLTDKNIIEELIKAMRRGVKVAIVIDDAGDNSPDLKAFRDAGGKHWIDKKHAIMHNKVMVIDQSVLVTGSFNFTRNVEERNAENLLIIRHPVLAGKYLENWRLHQGHSELYKE